MKPFHRLLTLILAVFGAALLPTAGWACPFCDGGPSGTNEVREAIFGEDFWFNLGAAGLPFVAVLALALVIHGVPTGRTNPPTAPDLAGGGVDGRAH